MNDETRAARLQQLARLRAAGVPAANGLESLVTEVAARAAEYLASLDPEACDAFLLRLVDAIDAAAVERQAARDVENLAQGRPVARRLTPEELEWAKAQYTDEEILDGYREIQRTGGLQLADFLPDLERAARGDG